MLVVGAILQPVLRGGGDFIAQMKGIFALIWISEAF